MRIQTGRALLFALLLTLGISLLAAPSYARVDLSARSVGPWADQMFGRAYQEGRLSGLALVVVQDGKVTVEKTYGYADFAAKRPIDPALTRFRIGSISKTVLVAALGRLRDEGKIVSFDDPANKYLKRVRLPKWRGREITLWDLMNHRGGFEERAWYYDRVAVPLKPEEIRQRTPLQDFKSGDTSNYCNFCSSILGFAVEDITGRLLADVEDEDVFRPLAMSQSLLNMSTIPEAHLGVPYTRSGGKPARFPYASIPEFFAAAGSVDATMDDMGRYMIGLLGGQGGEFLSPATRASMFTVHARNHPDVSGFGMIWMLHDWNGTRVIEHGGQIAGYHSILALFPDSNGGIFISCLCADLPIKPAPGGKFSLTGYNFREMIYQHFLGTAPVTVEPDVDPAQYTGYYDAERGDSRWPYLMLRIFKPTAFRRGITHVVADGGGLMINGFGPYVPVKNDTFRFPGLNRGDPYVPYPNLESLTFLRDPAGRVDRITYPLSLATSRKIDTLQRPDIQRLLLFGGAALTAIALFNGLWRLPRSRAGRLARAVAWTLAGSGVALAAAAWAASNFHWLDGELTIAHEAVVAWLFTALAVLTVAATFGILIVAGALWRGWSNGAGGSTLPARCMASLAASGGLMLSLVVLMAL